MKRYWIKRKTDGAAVLYQVRSSVEVQRRVSALELASAVKGFEEALIRQMTEELDQAPLRHHGGRLEKEIVGLVAGLRRARDPLTGHYDPLYVEMALCHLEYLTRDLSTTRPVEPPKERT